MPIVVFNFILQLIENIKAIISAFSSIYTRLAYYNT